MLHAHLPFVRHPEYADALEERWLFEAISETYLPLLSVIQTWRRDGIDFRLTLSLSPPLVAMLRDPLLATRYRAHLESQAELARSEVVRTRWLPEEQPAARHYQGRFAALLALHESIRGDVAGAFAHEARREGPGQLELITCTATHGFLPLLQAQPAAVRAQVRLGVAHHRQHFDAPPAGLWNAECGYYPGLHREFAAAGLGYFFVDSHALLGGNSAPRRGVYAPVVCPSGIAAFARDPLTSHEVWSSVVGYPADPLYREFYRDIGHDLEFEYIRPYLHESGMRLDTGLKYHRVTGTVGLGGKSAWNPAAAARRALQHGDLFIRRRIAQCVQLGAGLDRPPLIVAPFDAELFGHWWYEGPLFLDRAMRRAAAPGSPVLPVTPSQYLDLYPLNEPREPGYSSWGEGGYAGVWLDPAAEWIYRGLHAAAQRLGKLAAEHAGTADPRLHRTLNQMTRELLLAQSSDWAFMMKMKTAAQYAEQRTRAHLDAFEKLRLSLHSGADPDYLADLEHRNNIFPHLQFEIFRP